MKILSCAGEELGSLAAVVENHTGDVTGFLLVRPQPPCEYRLVSAAMIRETSESTITLKLAASEVDGLPTYERGA